MQGSVWACQTVRILYWAVCAYRALDGSGLFADVWYDYSCSLMTHMTGSYHVYILGWCAL